MSRKSSAVAGGDKGTVDQYNFVRDEAKMSAFLLASATSTLKLYVHDGTVYFRGTKVDFTGGLTPVMAAPTASSRIDIVSMASSSEIIITSGVEADSPTAPTAPEDDMVICEVYNRAGQVEITETDEAGSNGYINKDLRPALLLEKHASTTDKGIVEEATKAELNAGTDLGGSGAKLIAGSSILATSIYYVQLPSSDQKDALAGSGTPAAGNKFVTADTDALKVLLSNKDTDGTLAADSDTKYPSQKAVKTYADTKVSDWTNGNTTRAAAAASGTQNIAHGLPRIPKKVKITAIYKSAERHSMTVYNGTTQSSISIGQNYKSTDFRLWGITSPQAYFSVGVVTFDATNIIITWTLTGTPGETTYDLLWEAEA